MGYYMVLPSVVALITNKKGEVLIGQDANSPRKPYPGRWNLPGGKLEAGESPEECIKREIKEELGLKVLSLKFLGVFHHSSHNFEKDYISGICGLGLCYKAKVKGKMTSTEQGNVHFASQLELKKLKLTPWSRYFLKVYFKK